MQANAFTQSKLGDEEAKDGVDKAQSYADDGTPDVSESPNDCYCCCPASREAAALVCIFVNLALVPFPLLQLTQRYYDLTSFIIALVASGGGLLAGLLVFCLAKVPVINLLGIALAAASSFGYFLVLAYNIRFMADAGVDGFQVAVPLVPRAGGLLNISTPGPSTDVTFTETIYPDAAFWTFNVLEVIMVFAILFYHVLLLYFASLACLTGPEKGEKTPLKGGNAQKDPYGSTAYP